MKITIFNVEHGACALISSDTGLHALVDCGHNSTTGWRPSVALPAMGINSLAGMFITNYDEDHVSDLPYLRERVGIQILYRNPTVSGPQLLALKNADRPPGRGIDSLITMTGIFTAPVISQPNWGNITFSLYWNNFPGDFVDENNLSVALFVHHPNLTVLFPGDLEKAGWRRLLQNTQFVQELQRVHVLVASHHGRENGCCEELFEYSRWNPQITIVSDDFKQFETQETTSWYRARSRGIPFDGGIRKVFTTRSDGNIFLEASGFGASIDTESRQLNALLRGIAE
ncbi:MAG TPA: hypothetical protein VHT51_13230 [Micropepsaceae bacterium]|nr:hypothetical protein [Micropepsaceae bacterium]